MAGSTKTGATNASGGKRPATRAASDSGRHVSDFRQILMWPIQLVEGEGGSLPTNHGEQLPRLDPRWSEVSDEFTEDSAEFQERHYAEFVAFMPDVQRFLYGEGGQVRAKLGAAKRHARGIHDKSEDGGPREGYGGSPIHVYRRRDVTAARVTLRPGDAPIDFAVARVELYFFFDVDIAIFAVELTARDLTLDQAQEALFRLGRAYPTNWTEGGEGANCCARFALLGGDGQELAVSDYADKDAFLRFVCEHRTPRIATHWQYLLAPLVPEQIVEATGRDSKVIPFRPLEHQRIPLFAALAIDAPEMLTRENWMRLALAAPAGAPGVAPFSPTFLADFEAQYCYDRYWDPAYGHDQITTRMLCSGHAFVMVGRADDPRFVDANNGITGQFRHQYFLLGMIAHFHRAGLLVFRDRLVTAISGLTDYGPGTVKAFKRVVRLTHENFLRFTHRYWFHELSNQAAARDLFAMWVRQLGTDRLFAEVREEVLDMIDYLDSDALRRQANTVVRLTVVTFFGLIVSLTMGFLGAELISLHEMPWWKKALHVGLVVLPMAGLILYAAKKSQRLAEFIDAISNERLSLIDKWRAFCGVWRRKT